MSEKLSMALRPDAQAFDEVRITTVPRWKESELSGCEWRISAKIEYLRNGVVKHEAYAGDTKTACGLAYYHYVNAMDNAKGYFASADDFCDQEGCKEKATVVYQLKETYCNRGHKNEKFTPQHRQFCERHKHRGDQSFEDSDSNYVEVSE